MLNLEADGFWAVGLPDTHPIFCKFVPGLSEKHIGEKRIVLQLTKKSVHLVFFLCEKDIWNVQALEKKDSKESRLSVRYLFSIVFIKTNLSIVIAITL